MFAVVYLPANSHRCENQAALSGRRVGSSGSKGLVLYLLYISG